MGCTVTHAEPPRMVHFPGSVLNNGSRAPASTNGSRQAGLFSADSSSDTTSAGMPAATASSYSNHVTGAGNGNGAASPADGDDSGSASQIAVEPRQLEPRRISAITQFCINRTRAKSITEVELLNVEDGEDAKNRDMGTIKQHQWEDEGQNRN